MTPADHYAEAERLLRFTEGTYDRASLQDAYAAAQVHATLATVPTDTYMEALQ
jgi:muconolactone delta-isomerase